MMIVTKAGPSILAVRLNITLFPKTVVNPHSSENTNNITYVETEHVLVFCEKMNHLMPEINF